MHKKKLQIETQNQITLLNNLREFLKNLLSSEVSNVNYEQIGVKKNIHVNDFLQSDYPRGYFFYVFFYLFKFFFKRICSVRFF